MIQILFHIGQAVGTEISLRNQSKGEVKNSMAHEDEKDRLIELKAIKIAVLILGVGFLLALIGLVLKWETV